MDTQYLVDDIKEEVLEGAPGSWEVLGEGKFGAWEFHRADEILHFIVNKLNECAKYVQI